MTAPTASRQTERLERQKWEADARPVEPVESGVVVGLGAGIVEHGLRHDRTTDLLAAGDDAIQDATRALHRGA